MVSKQKKRDKEEEEQQQHSPKKTATNPYEKSKEQRIKENKEKMQQLGLTALALQLNKRSSSHNKNNNKPKNKKPSVNAALDQPTRQSSRLKEVPRVSYHEQRVAKEREKAPKNMKIRIENGDQPEIYTEEHLKLLGDCKTPWIGDNGNKNRTHDQENGKSCHQCRQKTLGLRVQCSQCRSGQFCGDCLYTRYGENLIKAKEDANWICPICRDICNCSNCRVKKGWKPTKNIYKQAVYLGYKSVAHYLIHTRQENSVRSSGETENKGFEKSSSVSEDKQPLPHNESFESDEESEI